MKTTVTRIVRWLTLAAVAAGVVAGTAGCAQPAVAYPTPQVWTVTYQGAPYCGYLYSPYEIDMYGTPVVCTRMQFPNATSTIVAGTLQAALLGYLERYDGFYHSGYWYDEYYAPIGPRYHVTVVNHNVFTASARTFDTKYAPAIKQESAKAAWKGTRKTGAYQFPTSNAKAKKAKPLTGTTGTGRTTAGTSGTHDERPPTTRTRTGSTGKTGGSSGKTGTTSRGGGSGGRRR